LYAIPGIHHTKIREQKLKKPYWLILAVLFIVGLDWFIQAPDSRARQLTAVLTEQGSEELKKYPYQFWVMRVDGGTAMLSTPRSREVPALKVLKVLYPEIDTSNPNDPQFVAAEKRLAEVQAEARKIIAAQPGVTDVRWELDRKWLASRSIELPDKL
jgi:hypothetical protein